MLSADMIKRTMVDMMESVQTALASGLQQLSKSVSPNRNTYRSNRDEIRQRIVNKYWGQASGSPDNHRTAVATTQKVYKTVSLEDDYDTPPAGWNANCNRSTDRHDGNVSRRSPLLSRSEPPLKRRMNGATRSHPTARDPSRAMSLGSFSTPTHDHTFRKSSDTCPTQYKECDNEMKYIYTKRLVSYEMNSMLKKNAQTGTTRETRSRSCDLERFQPIIECTVQYLESVKFLRVVMRQPPNLSGDTRKLYAVVHLSHGENQQIQKQTVEFMGSTNIKSCKHVCFFTGFSMDEVNQMALEVTVMRRRLLLGLPKTVGKTVAQLKDFGDLCRETKIVQTICTSCKRLHSV